MNQDKRKLEEAKKGREKEVKGKKREATKKTV